MEFMKAFISSWSSFGVLMEFMKAFILTVLKPQLKPYPAPTHTPTRDLHELSWGRGGGYVRQEG